MNRVRKPFRAEALVRGESPSPSFIDTRAQDRHAELLAEIARLRALIKPAAEISNDAIETFRKELSEAAKMKSELDSIKEAIQRTKQEIATLHGGSFESAQMSRVSGELSAVVAGTETATQAILEAAEFIDDNAMQIASHAKSETEKNLAGEIQEKVVSIFEACNFQDLTGQRINKVVTTFAFIEHRIEKMIAIWGGIEQFKDVKTDDTNKPTGDKALLNGPALETDAGRASQDDIDALFG